MTSSKRITSLECMTYVSCGFLSSLRKDRLRHNSKPQHVVPLCIVFVTCPLQLFLFYQRQNSHNIYFASRGKIDSIFLTWVTWKFSEC